MRLTRRSFQPATFLLICALIAPGCGDDPGPTIDGSAVFDAVPDLPPAPDGRQGQGVDVVDSSVSTADSAPPDAPQPADSRDAMNCPSGYEAGYITAGCGIAAQFGCINSRPDAALCSYCGCDGRTIMDRCEGRTSPWRSQGLCDGTLPDGGPVCRCAADEICVQLNDSTSQCRSPTPTVACRKVSAACRAKLKTDVKHCVNSSECETEYCPSPYQCRNSPPCGNEITAVAVRCYGP